MLIPARGDVAFPLYPESLAVEERRWEAAVAACQMAPPLSAS
ncbi:MAG TPA: hypothetical protein VGM69_27580 [Chloroflexota bacterium]